MAAAYPKGTGFCTPKLSELLVNRTLVSVLSPGGRQVKRPFLKFFHLKVKPEILSVCAGRALSSVVEHYLHTVGVAGSKPAARTILFLGT